MSTTSQRYISKPLRSLPDCYSLNSRVPPINKHLVTHMIGLLLSCDSARYVIFWEHLAFIVISFSTCDCKGLYL